MRAILFTLVVIAGFTVNGFGRDRGQDTLWYSSHWVKVSKPEASFFRLVAETDSGYRTNDYYLFGKLFRTGCRLSIESECYIYRTGTYEYYDSLGYLVRTGRFDSGRRVGTWRGYYLHSKALKNEDHYRGDSLFGQSLYYDEQTGRISGITVYDSGKQETRIHISATGDTTFTISTRKGKTDETIEYYNTKAIKTRTVYKDNKVSYSECFDRQGKTKDCEEDTASRFVYVEQMPSAGYDYNGFLGDNIDYPTYARRHNIEGRVIVKFVVDEDGTICNVHVAKGVHETIDAEAVRVVSDFPAWKPGYQNHVAVRVYFTLPINFKLK